MTGSSLAAVLSRATGLEVKEAEEGPLPALGRIVVARPNLHLLVDGDQIRLSTAATENHSRPAIDVLFRTAAAALRDQVVAVLLSGALDDGTAGLLAIRACGGATLVQDPEEAQFQSMPSNAVQRARPDVVAQVDELPDLIRKLTEDPLTQPPPEVPEAVALEVQILLRHGECRDQLNQLGEPCGMSCPGCGGPLWEIHDRSGRRYRCHIGHGLSPMTLDYLQQETVERSLLQALRLAEERVAMFERMHTDLERVRPKARSMNQVGFRNVDLIDSRAEEAEEHVKRLREILHAVSQDYATDRDPEAPGIDAGSDNGVSTDAGTNTNTNTDDVQVSLSS